jgi:MORN repeat
MEMFSLGFGLITLFQEKGPINILMGQFMKVFNVRNTGSWKGDLPHGYGKEEMADGSVYEGNYVRGLKQGEGKITF